MTEHFYGSATQSSSNRNINIIIIALFRAQIVNLVSFSFGPHVKCLPQLMALQVNDIGSTRKLYLIIILTTALLGSGTVVTTGLKVVVIFNERFC